MIRVIAALALFISTSAFGADAAMLSAAKEFSAIELLIKSFIIFGGMCACGKGIMLTIESAGNGNQMEGSRKMAGPLLVIVGVSAISVSQLVNVGANTIYSDAASDISKTYASNHSIDADAMMRYVDNNEYFQSAEVKGKYPEKIIKVLNMFIAIYGWYSISRGYGLWKLSVTSGSAMAGTDFASKKGYIIGHFVAGIGLIQIGPTMQIISGFGKTIVNAVSS